MSQVWLRDGGGVRQRDRRDQVGGLTEPVEGSVELSEGLAQWIGKSRLSLFESRRAGAPDPQVHPGDEERDAAPQRGDDVAGGVGQALNQALEAQAAQVIGHGSAGVSGQVASEQGSHERPEVAIPEALRKQGEVAERLEQRHCAGIAEAEGGSSLAGFHSRLLEVVEQVWAEQRVVTDPLGRQQALIDRLTGGPQRVTRNGSPATGHPQRVTRNGSPATGQGW